MILYHGSMVVVDKPRILARTDGRGADFGIGFYTTSSYDQAVRWVHIRQQNQATTTLGFVSYFEVTDNLLKLPDLRVRRFLHASRAWLHFVHENRSNPQFEHSYDIVKGPVANDRVYTTLTLWESGFYDEEQTIRQLKTFKLIDQYLLHTDKALAYLHFLKAEEIR